VKRLGVCVLGAALCLALATANFSPAGDGQDKGKDKDKKGKSDLFKPPKDQKKPKPRDVIGTVELKDGSTVQCHFLTPKEMTVHAGDIGTVAVPMDQVRFVELEAPMNRVSTFGLDLYIGKIQTEKFRVKLLNTGKEFTIPLDRVKRMVFPEPPPPIEPILPLEPEKEKEKDKDKDKPDD
jgi:hypothetical protein